MIEHCGAPHTQSLTFTLLSESKCEGERLGVAMGMVLHKVLQVCGVSAFEGSTTVHALRLYFYTLLFPIRTGLQVHCCPTHQLGYVCHCARSNTSRDTEYFHACSCTTLVCQVSL